MLADTPPTNTLLVDRGRFGPVLGRGPDDIGHGKTGCKRSGTGFLILADIAMFPPAALRQLRSERKPARGWSDIRVGSEKMGFSVTWCAVREEGAQRLLEQLGLSPTGQTEEVPQSLISTVKLDTGWRIIWYNKYGCPFLRSEDLRDISNDLDVLVCLIEEHVMASSSEMWCSGKRKWWISHEGEDRPKGLSTDGELPECLSLIGSEMEEAQRAEGGDDADVDYIFEVPLKVAQSLTGFKHDENCPHMVGQFVVLSTAAQTKSFFGRLLSK